MYILYRNWKIDGNGEIKSTENSLLITEDKISKTSSRLWFSFDELWWIINEIAEKQISRFTSSLVPLFQNESKCETIQLKMSSACSFIFMPIKVIFIRMVSHLELLWNRGARELGNGLFWLFLASSFTKLRLLTSQATYYSVSFLYCYQYPV